MASDKESKAFKIERYFTPKVTVICGYHSAMICMVLRMYYTDPQALYLCLITKAALSHVKAINRFQKAYSSKRRSNYQEPALC